jgi:hypothetical protein
MPVIVNDDWRSIVLVRASAGCASHNMQSQVQILCKELLSSTPPTHQLTSNQSHPSLHPPPTPTTSHTLSTTPGADSLRRAALLRHGPAVGAVHCTPC